MRSTVLVALVSLALAAPAQSPEAGKQIYSANQDSVFLIYLNDASGSPQALGSGFLVAPNLLVTNAHVANAGNPVLATGPVRIPLKIVNLDTKNDLATLSFTADLTSKPLSLASQAVNPGEQVYVIGNPEGLEKTISQGIVSALRTDDGRELIQITAPISHGSSGGPVFNEKGEVIGVAVGMLGDGQNLNFAVPVKYVSQLLAKKANSQEQFDLREALKSVASLLASRNAAQFSSDPDSPYQTAQKRLQETLEDIFQKSDDPEALHQVSCDADYGLAVRAAQKLASVHPGPDNEALLSYTLLNRATLESFTAYYSKDDKEKAEAKDSMNRYLNEATAAAQRSLRAAKGNTLQLADYVLASAKEDEGDYTDAIALNTRLVTETVTECGNDLSRTVLDNLISENEQAGHPEDAENWFKVYASKYTPYPFEWDKAGDRRHLLHDASGSAEAYENAAGGSDAYGYDYCYAATARFTETPQNGDTVLADGRACVDASIKGTSDNKKYFDSMLPEVYSDMSEILEGRGVYQGALEYAKEAVNLKPDYAWGLSDEADAYFSLRQFDECIAAGEAAIRASDGKFPSMQFRLGNCYFEEKNWPMAENSFRIVAEAHKYDASAAFNLGLSLLNEGHDVDGNQWLREALKRNPDDEIRAKILNLLKP